MSGEKQKTILLVDDEAIIAMAEKMTLEKYGYSVITANSGEEAVATVGKTPAIDLVLMDINLGAGIDGTEAAVIILGQRDLPVVFLSGHSEPEVVAKTEKITSYGYVVKNSSITVLDASIKMAFKLFEAKIREKEKEASLRESEVRLAEAQAVAKVGSWETDLINLNVIWSEETYRIFEIDPGSLHLTQAGFLAFTHPEDCAKVDAAFLGSLDTNSLNAIEHRIVTPNGLVKFIEERWRIFQDDQGRPVRAVGTCQDITDRKRVEETLHESEEWNKVILHTVLSGVIVIEAATRKIVEVNDTALKLIGLPKEQVIGFVCHQFVCPAEERNCPILDFGKEVDFSEKILLTADGKRKDIIKTVVPVQMHGQKYLIESFVDISESKRAESQREAALEALQKIEERQQLILATLPIAIFTSPLDPDIDASWVSGDVEKVTGFSADEYMAEKDFWRSRLHVDDRERVLAAYKDPAAGDEIVLEYRWLCKDGNYKWFYDRAIKKRTRQGIQYFGMILDISDRKREEEEMRKLASVVRHSSELINLSTPDGRMIFLNEAGSEMLGISPAEVNQINIMQVIPAHLKDKVEKELLPALFNTGKWSGDMQYLNMKTGQLRDFLSTTFVIKDPGTEKTLYLANVSKDITERKRAESQAEDALEALRESEVRLKAQYQGMPMPTCIWQKKGEDFELIDFNDAAKVITHDKVIEFVGRKASDLYANRQDILRDLQQCYVERKIIKRETLSEHFVPGKLIALTIVSIHSDLVMVHMEDITERRRVEEKLQESEKRYRALVENASDIVLRTDKNGCFTFVNPVGLRISGYEEGEVIGKHYSVLLHPDMRAQIIRHFNRQFIKGIQNTYSEYPLNTKDGHLVWIGQNTQLIVEDGQVTGFQAVSRDITEQKLAEEALQQYNQKWEAIIIASPDGIGMISLAGKLQLMSDKLLAMYGYSIDQKDEILKKTVFDFIDPSNHKMLIDNMRKLLAGNKDFNVSEYLAVKKDNSKFYIEVSSSVLFDSKGDPESILFVERDITERRRAEDALRESEERYRDLVENSQDLICTHDLKGKVLSMNETAARFTGYPLKDLLNMNLADLLLPEVRHLFKVYLAEIQAKGWARGTMRVQTASGEPRYWEFHNTLRTSGVTVPVVRGVGRDITEREHAEKEIKRQLAEKGILLKEVHHRIKNNIASIGGLLTLQMQTVTNAEAIAVLQDANSRVNSMRLLYDKLLLTEEYKDISVKNYLYDLIDTIIAIFPDKAKIKFEKRIADFQLDPKRLFPLGCIINELLTNTMKYAFINRKTGLIKISLANAAKHVMLTVQDNGVGLPAGFDINESKGFGLMLVKMLSQQLGGSFSMEKHRGTRCMIEFDI